MKTASDYRIENARDVTLNGRKVRAFDAYVKQGFAFVFLGAYSAPSCTARGNLWLIPNQSDTGSID